jgi:hypothetical protein
MNDFDSLERDLGPSLRLALRERAAAITDGHRPLARWEGGNGGPTPTARGNSTPLRDASLNLEDLEPPALTIPDAERTAFEHRASRRWMAAAAAVAAVVLLVSVLLATDRGDDTQDDPPAGPGPAPTVETTDEVSSTNSIPEGEAASGQVTSELVASINWLHDIAPWGTGTVYVYADGRVISIGTGGPTPDVWVERRFTTDGVAFVQSELISTGLFDPDGPDGAGGLPPVVVRLDGRLVAATGQQANALAARVRDLEAWLPADAWVDREPATWEPTRQAICLERNTRSGVQRRLEDPASVIRALPEPAATILGDTQPWTPRSIGPRGPHCYDVSNDAAREVAEALDVEVANGSMSGGGGNYGFDAGPPISAPVAISTWPLLPHGQPAYFGA